jgi:hypothetical protein
MANHKSSKPAKRKRRNCVVWIIVPVAITLSGLCLLNQLFGESNQQGGDLKKSMVSTNIPDAASTENGPSQFQDGEGQLDVTMATPTPVPPDQRLILTYYFYWYDAYSGGHLREEDGLNLHPLQEPAASWRNVEWHKKEFADMTWAGIDVALPVYWGFHNPKDGWSYEALPIIAEAWYALKAEGIDPPQIGMFFDTTIIDGRDLTSQSGKEFFYANIRDFFSRIPPEQWALINGRPVVFLFTSDWTEAMDQTTFTYVYEHFTTDFGVRPYIVREASWNYPILGWQGGERIRDFSQAIETDNSYPWAGSILGYTDNGGVAAIGPGYDERGMPGRGGLVVDRENGDFYRRNFEAAIASGKPLLVIETWNELHEGSGICESIEFGRYYLELTRELAEKFHHPNR